MNTIIAVMAIGLLVILITPYGHALDWTSVQERDVALFYPGQASWEWVLTKADHSGATKFREGKNCMECHSKEEKVIGKKIVTGEKLEPQPIAGQHPPIGA